MRCKNCGFENDENLYICQNCGSPLYDEDEPSAADDSKTVLFNPLTMGVQQEQPPVQNQMQEPQQPYRNNAERLQREREEEKKKQQQIIIIVVLSVVLAAIVIGTIIAFATRGKKNDEATSRPSVTVTQNAEDTSEKESTTEATTKETTTKETTTKETTTKETTTTAKTFKVTTTSNEGGETEGDGSYKLGDKAVLIARADDGYVFDGWYINSEKVSSDEVYNYVVTKDSTVQAVFVPAPTEPSDQDITDGTSDIDVIEGQD